MRRGSLLAVFVAAACSSERFADTSSGLDARPVNETCIGRSEFPELLADTGCFDRATLEPIDALVPYGVEVALWADGLDKDRYLALPDGEVLSTDRFDRLVLPPGGVLVKSFSYAGAPLETRLLVTDERGEWHAATYLWNEAGTEARLFEGGLVERAGQTFEIPSRTECFECHTTAAGMNLGLERMQLDAPFTYPSTGRTANQLDTLAAVGMLEPIDTLDRGDVYRADDVRAYLHVNCAYCHRPGGEGAGMIDLRYSTPLALTHTCGERPERGDPTDREGLLIAPGAVEHSVVHWRMQTTDPLWRMPPLGTRVPDEPSLELLAEWISGMAACEE